MSSSHDFDFFHGGPWEVHNRRLGADGQWQSFTAQATVKALAADMGNMDFMSVPALPDGTAVEAFTVRLYDPEEDLWRIWWSASTRPGHLDPPMVGRFDDGVGVFEGDDALAPGVRLRFIWKGHEPDGPHWEQARSSDGGETWRTDWTMDFRPASCAAALSLVIYNQMVIDSIESERADAIFHALADPTRRDVLATVLREPSSVSELARRYPISFAAVHKHVGTLERAGLVVKTRHGREQRVSGDAATLRSAHRLLDELETVWRGRIGRMEQLLAEPGEGTPPCP